MTLTATTLLARVVRSPLFQLVTRITLGLGTMATLVSINVGRSTTAWDVIGLTGLVMIVVSLPVQFYVLYVTLVKSWGDRTR